MELPVLVRQVLCKDLENDMSKHIDVITSEFVCVGSNNLYTFHIITQGDVLLKRVGFTWHVIVSVCHRQASIAMLPSSSLKCDIHSFIC